MNTAGKILKVSPPAAIAGGEIYLECDGFTVRADGDFAVLFDGIAGNIVGASAQRIIVNVPDTVAGKIEIRLRSGDDWSDGARINIGEMLIDDLHSVANPAYDADAEKLVVTRSGSRGQQLPATLFRLGSDGELEEISGDVMNPTGIAFNKTGEMFVTSRAEGNVYRISRADEAVLFASDLGIATGLAFNRRGEMFVGDRSGTIYKVDGIGSAEVYATLEQSIAAYHLAFDKNDNLYVTRPNVSSFDSVMRIDTDGEVSTFYRGLSRPQGLAFDRAGNLYVAACLGARRGIVRVTPDADFAELVVAGARIVGLCFGANGELYLATNDSIFSLDLETYGILID